MNEENKESSDDPVGDAAIKWFVRMRAGTLSSEERTSFETWLASDEANAAAFEDILHMYGHLAGMRPSRRAKWGLRPSRRSSVAGATIIALGCLALFISIEELSSLLWSDYYAGVGERRLVTLDDGSRVQLDSRSSIAIHYGAAERRLTLLNGEAWFEVVPDATRPFIVEAGGGTVTALGTAFDVALEKDGARVTVTNHRVMVSSASEAVVVKEGQQTVFGQRLAPQRPSTVDAESVTAWRRGKLIVEKQPLGDVIASLGRYRRGLVYCIEAATCARRVTGVFGVDDPDQSLREIEASLGLRAMHITKYLIVLY
jgi:transmembrane sensor